MFYKRYLFLESKFSSYYLYYLVFLFLAILGYQISDDYGIGMDAIIQRKHGVETYNYILSSKRISFPQYGVVFSFPMYIFEKVFKIRNLNEIYF